LKNFSRILISTIVLAFGISAFADPHKLRVDDPALAKTLVAQGAKVVGDYGAFTVLEADDALLAGGASNRVEIADDWNLIRLNARVLDTRAPEVKALRKPRGDFAGKRLHLIQFAGPIKPEWRAALKETGAEIVSYIPENTYLIYGDAAALGRLQTWTANSQITQWEGEYSRDLKMHSGARALAMTSANGKVEIDRFAIQLIVDTNANPATLALIDGLKSGPVRLDVRMANYRDLVVALPDDQLDAIAAQPDVISIHPYIEPKKLDERQDQIIAGNLSGHLPSGPGYLTWLADKGFTQAQFDASGLVVDVADSGIDNGTTTPGHFGFYEFGDTTKPDRVAYAYFVGTQNPGATLAGCDGHGALNAHIIGNYDAFAGPQHQDLDGFSYGIGVCPFVRIGSSVIFDNSVPGSDFTNPDFNDLASKAYAHGARISNNSWGGGNGGGDYDIVAQMYDALVRDAETNVVGNQEMTFAFAAGNAGPCAASKMNPAGIDSPGSAKNVITVGASENVRSLSIANGGNVRSGSDGCGETDANANSADDVDCSSSRGPCSDGRMKPDLVAPGIHITGGVPQVSPAPSPFATGEAIPCFDAEGVCALPGPSPTVPGNTNNYFPLGQQFYTVSSGTSHATPVVAGACALIRQFFINNNSNPPSPAMTKAFLINSARYLTGKGAGGSLWSPSQGMGEVNLGVAFDGVWRSLRDQVPADKFTATGQRRFFSAHIADPSKPVRVTVAWTDAPGSTAGAAYNNNLDLTVTMGGNTYKGNVFKGQFSTPGGRADRKNNVESVFLPAGLTNDSFSVLVTAANINSDGVPNEEPALDQDFALVIYNGVATSEPTYTAIAATYSGLFYEASGPALGRSGAITLNLTAADSYSGKLQLGPKSYPFSGVFAPTGSTTASVPRKGLSALDLVMNVDLDDNSVITGTVSDDGNWNADLRANRGVLNARTNAAAFAGRYTLLFPGTNGDPQLPAGDGYAAVTVSPAGQVKATGSLADGTKFAQSTIASARGEWPLYASLYGREGQILGWLGFTNSGPQNVGGTVNWIKAAVPRGKFYTNGFAMKLPVTGSSYNPALTPLLDFASGVVVLTGGNLPNDITDNINADGNAVSSTNKLTLKLNGASGSFKGSVPNPVRRGLISFSGVFLQNQDFGAGYFLGTNQSGRVFFGPAN